MQIILLNVNLIEIHYKKNTLKALQWYEDAKMTLFFISASSSEESSEISCAVCQRAMDAIGIQVCFSITFVSDFISDSFSILSTNCTYGCHYRKHFDGHSNLTVFIYLLKVLISARIVRSLLITESFNSSIKQYQICTCSW